VVRRRLRIKVRGYRRKGYTYRRRGKLIKVRPTRVRGFTYLRRDIGALGRGPKVIPKLREGAMSRAAREIGIRSLSGMTKRQARRLGRHLRRKYGQRRAFGMAHAQVVFRKRMSDGFKKRMKWVREATVGKKGVLD